VFRRECVCVEENGDRFSDGSKRFVEYGGCIGRLYMFRSDRTQCLGRQ
jgi:hypothetical protein